MRSASGLVYSGIAIYIILSGIDRFVWRIPNPAFIPFALVGITMILIGSVRGGRGRQPARDGPARRKPPRQPDGRGEPKVRPSRGRAADRVFREC